jgi:hypothetical protein
MKFCDLKCVHASAPKDEMDGARSCMTFTALWCDLYDIHVMKSQRCLKEVELEFEKASAKQEDKQ